MKIGNVEAAPLAAVHGVAEHGAREGCAPRPQKAPKPPATAHDESPKEPPPVHKPVTLPEFAQYELSFRLDEERGRVVVQVIDKKTGTIVRTVPPEELGRAARRLPDPRGLLLDREG